MKTNPPACLVRETIDLLPEVLELIDRRLSEIFHDDSATLEYRSVLLELGKLTPCVSAHIDAYYNNVLQNPNHVHLTTISTRVSRASVYNNNKKYKKIQRNERLSKI